MIISKEIMWRKEYVFGLGFINGKGLMGRGLLYNFLYFVLMLIEFIVYVIKKIGVELKVDFLKIYFLEIIMVK